MTPTLHTEAEVRASLRSMFLAMGPTLAAQTLSVGAKYLEGVLAGKYAVSKKLAKRLGYRARIVFERSPPALLEGEG